MHEERPSLSHRHRVITEDDLGFIRRLIAEHPGSSRLALSKKLCQAWNWVQPNGALRDMVCRSLMLKLHRAEATSNCRRCALCRTTRWRNALRQRWWRWSRRRCR